MVLFVFPCQPSPVNLYPQAQYYELLLHVYTAYKQKMLDM